MKAEDRIVELLAEYLQKTDRALARLDENSDFLKSHTEILQNQTETLKKHAETLGKHDDEIVELRREASKREIQQGVLLEEILKISKRVVNLEDQRRPS